MPTPRLEDFVRADVLRKTGERQPDQRLQVEAMDGFVDVAAHLRQQAGAGHRDILLALRDVQVGQDYVGILLERQVDGVLEGELQRCGLLGKRCAGNQNEAYNAGFHKQSHSGLCSSWATVSHSKDWRGRTDRANIWAVPTWSMPSLRILACRVVRFMPRRAAAP